MLVPIVQWPFNTSLPLYNVIDMLRTYYAIDECATGEYTIDKYTIGEYKACCVYNLLRHRDRVHINIL